MAEKIDKLMEDAKGLRRHLLGQGHSMSAHTVAQMMDTINALRSELRRAELNRAQDDGKPT
jgi:hypothetical protein